MGQVLMVNVTAAATNYVGSRWLNKIQPIQQIEVFSVECGHVAAPRSNAVAATVMS